MTYHKSENLAPFEQKKSLLTKKLLYALHIKILDIIKIEDANIFFHLFLF